MNAQWTCKIPTLMASGLLCLAGCGGSSGGPDTGELSLKITDMPIDYAEEVEHMKVLIVGGGGNDQLYGGNQADMLEGGADDDTLYGGADNDVLDGGGENDVLYGEIGDDVLAGFTGNDVCYAVDEESGTKYYVLTDEEVLAAIGR